MNRKCKVWLVHSKDGELQSCWEQEPSANACAKFDTDVITKMVPAALADALAEALRGLVDNPMSRLHHNVARSALAAYKESQS